MSATPGWAMAAVAFLEENQVVVVDLRDMRVARGRSIAVPQGPQEILVRPDGRVAYVSCAGDGKVAAIDLEQWESSGADHGRQISGWARVGEIELQSEVVVADSGAANIWLRDGPHGGFVG